MWLRHFNCVLHYSLANLASLMKFSAFWQSVQVYECNYLTVESLESDRKSCCCFANCPMTQIEAAMTFCWLDWHKYAWILISMRIYPDREHLEHLHMLLCVACNRWVFCCTFWTDKFDQVWIVQLGIWQLDKLFVNRMWDADWSGTIFQLLFCKSVTKSNRTVWIPAERICSNVIAIVRENVTKSNFLYQINVPCRQLEKIPSHMQLQTIFPRFASLKIAARGEPIKRNAMKWIVWLFGRFVVCVYLQQPCAKIHCFGCTKCQNWSSCDIPWDCYSL